MASSSSFSSCALAPRLKKHDVFISFYGKDIREGFLSHLQKELKQNQIYAFVDENLERGEDILSSLLAKIEESYVSIVIFSENYAYSSWCLDELVKILECNIERKQIIIPVFYGINPTHVQELEGSYCDAIVKHKKESNNNSNKLDAWISALKKISNLSSFVAENIKPDSKLIEQIVNHTLKKLDDLVISSDYWNDGLVGINSRVKDVEELLCLELVDVRRIGIWGMGGIGKTTIASKIFERIWNQFQGRCFIANGYPLFCPLLSRESSHNKKILIILDDVSDVTLVSIDFLIGKHVVIGSGSRIIVTSRDKQLLKNVGTEIYKVKKLNDHEALELFSFHAFKQNFVKKEFMKLSRKAIDYASGNPLALKVLGSNLFEKTLEEWEDKLRN
ncbi:disease resistance-like protein DSC1 [Hevea brasiliensis]|uniref:disease resistance-like protein DSC1 n=1 Tax=Hevea brasiliensis TaxID=3981 RepID=UPI0025F7954E|nr:disease resistance-like protein DSC1 [Hevea brasiliensis]